jgi:hypothetical protein
VFQLDLLCPVLLCRRQDTMTNSLFYNNQKTHNVSQDRLVLLRLLPLRAVARVQVLIGINYLTVIYTDKMFGVW